MCGKIVMCADSASLANPACLGLPDERLESQGWIETFSSGVSMRSFLRSEEDVGEVWVFSSDDVEAINVAAAVKRDRPSLPVYLVSFDGGGSLRSRAQAAGLNGVLDRTQFSSRYSFRKCSAARLPSVQPSFPQAGLACHDDCANPPASAGLAIAMESEFLRGMDLEKLSKGAPEGVSTVRVASAVGEKGPQGSRRACLISVASASGGSGKSTVSALIGLFASGMGFKTLVLDGDLQFGEMHSMLGEESPCRIDEVAFGMKPFPDPCQDGDPAIVASPDKIEVSEAVAPLLSKVIDDACSAYDVVVVNTGSLWDEQQAAVFERSSSVIMLVAQSASSLGATKRAVEMFGRCGIPTSPLRFVLNGCKRGAPLSSIDVSCSLGGVPVFEFRDGGREVDELMAAGLAAELVEDENPLCVSIESLLDELLPDRDEDSTVERAEYGASRPARGRFSRLKRRVSCLC